MSNVLVSIIRSLYVPDFILLLLYCILILVFHWRVGLLFFLSIVFFFIWRIKAPIINSRYCISIQIFFIVSLAFALRIKQRQVKRIIVFLLFPVFIIHFFLSFSGSRNSFLFYLMDDAAFFLSHDRNASVFIEEKEYDRIMHSPPNNKQIVLLQAPQTHEDLDSIYYQYDQYEFWNNNAYLVFSEKKRGNSAGSLKKCLYNSDTTCKKIRNYIKSKNKYISVYFHEKFLPPSFENLKDAPTLNTIICNGILKSCSPFFDTYIYQVGNKLFWIVGADLQPNDEIIFQLYPTRREYLPPERVIHKFDNRGFRISTTNTKYEIGRYGKYRLFERTLPEEYPIQKIKVGYNINQNITWFKPFQPSKN